MRRLRSRRNACATSAPLRRVSRRRSLSVEFLEERIVLDAGLSDLAMLSATTADSRSVTFRYQATLASKDAPLTADVAFFRSTDQVFNPSDDLPIGSLAVTLADGEHTLIAPLSETLAIDPSHPYVLAVADPLNVIDESDETNNLGSFRIFTIGAVTHGFELIPGDTVWIDEMADSLKQSGYDVAINFHWDVLSFLPVPGMTSLAGLQLSGAVWDAVNSLSPKVHEGDVMALHMIGHSRGSVVISQAAIDLEYYEQLFPELAPLKAGPMKLTFLDPHPANNAYSGTLFSAAPNFLGQIGTALYSWFQSLALDPNVIVPASADWAEVYYQHTSYEQAQNTIESNFLLWGESPSDLTVVSPETHVSSLDLTQVAPGHSLVHEWYQDVITQLGSQTQALATTSTVSLSTATVSNSFSTVQPGAVAVLTGTLDELWEEATSLPGRRSSRPSSWLEDIDWLVSGNLSQSS